MTELIEKMDKIQEGIETKASKEDVEALKASKAELEDKVANLEKGFSRIEVKGNPIVELNGYKNAFRSYLTAKHQVQIPSEDIEKNIKAYGDVIFKGMPSDQIALATKALNESVNALGGYTVPADIMQMVIDQEIWSNAIRGNANVVTTGRDKVSFPSRTRLQGASWGKVAPAANSDEPFKMVDITVDDLMAVYEAEENLLMDSVVNIEQVLMSDGQDQFNISENYAFLLGDDIKKPMGIMSYPVSTARYEFGKLQYVQSGTSATFDADDMVQLRSKLHPNLWNGAAWYCNSTTLAHIMTLKDDAGQYILKQDFLTSDAMAGRVLGFPVYLCEDMDDLGASKFPLMLANLKIGYYIVDRVGMSILRDQYTQYPNIRWYIKKRVGGGVVRFDAIKLLKCKA